MAAERPLHELFASVLKNMANVIVNYQMWKLYLSRVTLKSKLFTHITQSDNHWLATVPRQSMLLPREDAYLQPRSNYGLPSKLCFWDVNNSSARNCCRRGIVEVLRFKKCFHMRCHEDSVSICKGQDLRAPGGIAWTFQCRRWQNNPQSTTISIAWRPMPAICVKKSILLTGVDVLICRPYCHQEQCWDFQSKWRQRDHQAQSRCSGFCF